LDPVEIVPLENNKKKIKKFVTSAWNIYQDNPFWVPPLIGDQVKSIVSGPYHEVGVMQPFLAYRKGKIVGRIIAHYDRRHNEYFKEKRGCVGFFESIHDTAVSRALFGAAEAWLKEKGMEEMQGPFNFTLYDIPGVLMDDYDNIPAVELNYNPPYYPDLYTDYGFVKRVDWYAYKITVEDRFPKLFYKMWEKVGKDAMEGKEGLVIRELNLKKFDEEKDKIFTVFNEAWSENWGHYPMTDTQMANTVKELKAVVKPEFVLIAEYGGEVAGFILSIPDVNPALKAANGRLFPFGLFKILWGMRNIDRLKTILMGIRPKYRMRGLDAYFYVETFERARKMGYTMADMSLIVEDNHNMRNALEHMGAKIYKTYRFFGKKI
jgi:GNAT superfamily N-acetyltransferase